MLQQLILKVLFHKKTSVSIYLTEDYMKFLVL